MRPLFLSLVVLSASPLAAQELETVLVTANRLETPGSDLALSWSAVDRDALRLTDFQHSNQLFQRVAGTWISRGNGQESLIALRSPVLTGPGSCGAFLTAVDGISLRAPGFCNVNQLFDANLEQAGAVEVIRGPGTAVYGTNALHGVINILTPSWQTTDNALRIEAGSRDYYRVLLGAGSEASGTALNVQASTYGGYQDASGFDQQRMTLRHDGVYGDWAIAAVAEGSNLNQETAGFIEGDDAYKDDDLRTQNPNPEAYRDAWSLRGHVTARRILADNRVLAVTPYWRNNAMTFLQHFLPWQPLEENGHRSLGLQVSLSEAGDRLRWITGVDIDATEGWLREVQDQPFSPNQPEGVHYDYSVDALVAGAFGQGSLTLTERWQLDAGLRLEHTGYDYNNRTGDGSACTPEASACRFFRPADRSDDFNNWTGNLGASVDLGQARIYGRLARGYRAPQTAELYRLQSGQAVADIDSEVMTSIEAGVRGASNTRVRWDINTFAMQKNEVIFQDRDRQNVSGAETEHIGVETTLFWQITEQVYADLAATLARHRYTSPIALLGSNGDIEGNDIDTAPRHFGSARLGADLGSISHPLIAELEFVWLDEYYVDPNNENRYDGHELLNLRVEWQPTAQLRTSLVVTNLLDTDYAERADFAFGNYRYFVGEPRSALVSISYLLD